MLGDIDLSKRQQRPLLYIALPNRTIIGELNRDAYNVKYDIFMGKINEITFSVPYQVDDKHELVRNPNIDKLKNRYLIKLVQGNFTEWYVMNDINDATDDEKADKEVHCFSLGWQLNDKLIRGYEDNVNAQAALYIALEGTTWNSGFVDTDFIVRTRSFSVTEKTSLDFIIEIADTFGAIIEFDTVNRLINLKKEDSIGTNKGLYLSYGDYLKTLNRRTNSDEMVTRLHAFGAENLSIQSLNMTGSTYIENFSTFLYPFEQDVNGNVINHSYYWSDNLCKKQLAYQDLIANRQPTFDSYISQLEQLQVELTALQTQMSTLQNELKIIEDQIFLAKGQELDTTTLNAQLSAKQTEINNKQTEIDSKNTEIANINNNITALRNEIAVENNFTVDEIKERNDFIIEKTWQDDNYIDEKDLFEEAKKRFTDLKSPKTTFNIDIVNFMNIVECQRDWDKISIGDTVNIKYEQFGVNITAKIIEVHFDYEGDNINLTISNTKDILDESIKLSNKIYDSYSTSTSLDMSKYKWDNASTTATEVNNIISAEWDATKREISAGVNNSISISGRGIVITNPDNPLKQLIAQSGVLALTQDGGDTWKTAIKPDKIVAQVVMGELITGNKLVIRNDTNTYSMDLTGFHIARSDDMVKVDITTTDGIKIQSKDEFGLYQDRFYVDTTGNTTFDGRLKITKNNTTLLESFMDVNGGKIEVNDKNGNTNVFIGSEGTGGANVGGTITLYNDSISKKRVAIGIIGSGDYGVMQVQDTFGTTRVEIFPNNIRLRDSNGLVVTSISENTLSIGNSTLASTYGNINGEPIATHSWVQSNTYGYGSSPYFSTIYGTNTALTIYSGGYNYINISNDGSDFIQSASFYNRTYSGSANAYVSSTGVLGRATSASKYKLNIEQVDTLQFPKILNLSPKSWNDKWATERYAEYLTKISTIDENGQIKAPEELPKDYEIPYLERYSGLIAEDVLDAGLGEFVIYGEPDATGHREVEGLMYDRLWTLLIPLVKEQQNQITDLQQRIAVLEGI